MHDLAVKVNLKGDLSRFNPGCLMFVSSVRELMRALEAQFSDFRQYLIYQVQQGINYEILVGGNHIGEESLDAPIGNLDVTIIPVPRGQGGNIIKIVAGVALLALGLTGVGIVGSAGATALLGGTLALSGVVGLFSTPEAPEDDSKKQSFIFSGAVNTSSATGVVPVVYGCGWRGTGLMVGSLVISAAIRTYAVDNDDDD